MLVLFRFLLICHCHGTVLYIWFVVKCGSHGWGNSQWSDCGIHRQERGMIDLCISTDSLGSSVTRLILRKLRKMKKEKKSTIMFSVGGDR